MARLHTQFTTESIVSNQITETDLAIRAYIDNNESGIFDEIISSEDNWQIFYHLSELRTGIINWYNFKPQAKILEIGAGFGALTGTLCRRCAHVTVTEQSLFHAEALEKRYRTFENLDIYVGKLEDIKLEQKFDYILLIGGLETISAGTSNQQKYVNFLCKLKDYLNSDGILLLAVENRYGLRYFCGAADQYTNHAFDGINRYPFGTDGYSFSRQELMDILLNSGFQHKFYYPLPDYKLPQIIYTDEYLPEKNLKERLIPYYRRRDTLIAVESELYDDIIDNQVFPFFANSFFVECNQKGTLSDVVYAAVSTDRGEENSYATTIHKDGYVRKQPLYPAGEKNAELLLENIEDLKEHNIPVVEHIWRNGKIELPYVNQPTLSNYIKTIISKDIEEFYAILDQNYSYILASSEEVPASENELLQYIPEERRKNAEELEWGPILKKAYMELIPLNCFYKDGNFLFFDQEFVHENYPAKYILFRAIHYIYSFTPNAENILPMEILKQKYALTQIWEFFLAEELRFLREVRKQDRYRQFYRWTKLDWNRIRNNVLALEAEEEQIASVKISERMRQIRKIELQLLDSIDTLCKEHGLRYYLIHGTLLGAVRHSGFIPWDDDIDIALPREDYDKLKIIAAKELPYPYFMQTPENDKECFYGGYMKLRNSHTTGIELINWGHACNHGIWIDIFPLDNCYNDPKKNIIKLKKVAYFQRLIYAQIYFSEKSFRNTKTLQWKYYRILAKFYRRDKLYLKLDQAFRQGDGPIADKFGIYTHYNGGKSLLQFDKKDFTSIEMLYFEHRKLPIPTGYKNCLKASFGEEYMHFPAREYRVPNHKAFFAPEIPYQIYFNRFMKIFEKAEGKTIVLFGAGLMFEDYMQKWGKEYSPSFLIDNNDSKWETLKLGIPVKSPEVLLSINKDKLHLIICNIYFRQIEVQLQRMGITEYYIYVQEKEWLTSDPPNNK